jgi:hydrogenase maturation protease
MNAKLVEEIANAVLYEGYLLYPYRASATKNQQRWNFGVLYPRTFCELQNGTDAWSMQTECLAQADANATLNVRVRFLQVVERTRDGASGEGRQEGLERDIQINSLDLNELPMLRNFAFPPEIEGSVQVEAERLEGRWFKIRVRILNTACLDGSTSRNGALAKSLVSTHTIVHLEGGNFVSLMNPPEELREAARKCENVGAWPVLVGEAEEGDAMLSSPIILYDYPQIAPESAGPLFDGTEIDEILTLRILTLSDEEKAEMGQTDERAREILERTTCLPPEQLMKMHGALRGLRRTERETP